MKESVPLRLKSCDKPTLFVVIGGAASGKNYWYENNLSNIPLVDVDVYMKESVDDSNPRNIGMAIAKATLALEQAFKNKTSVVQTTTGSGLTAVENKFKKARMAEMKTVLILVDTDSAMAIQRNEARVKDGGHGATLTVEKIERTNLSARETYKMLANSTVVDMALRVKG